jgi:phosphoribosylformimino-5-aminoimidazole carboxamide ribonucleotide (ProFAR) isomerase
VCRHPPSGDRFREDIRALAGLTAIGVEGAIVGKALYAGAFTLPEALRVTEESA